MLMKVFVAACLRPCSAEVRLRMTVTKVRAGAVDDPGPWGLLTPTLTCLPVRALNADTADFIAIRSDLSTMELPLLVNQLASMTE